MTKKEISSLSKIEILNEIFFIKKNLIEKLVTTFDLLIERQPQFSTKQIVSEIYEIENSRAISFDSINSTNSYTIFNYFEFWLRNKLSEYSSEFKQKGILLDAYFLSRDKKETTVSSIENNIIFIEMILEKDIEKQIPLISEKLYGIIQFFQEKISKKYKKLKMLTLPKVFDILDMSEIKTKKILFNELDLISSKVVESISLETRYKKNFYKNGPYVKEIDFYINPFTRVLPFKIFSIKERNTDITDKNSGEGYFAENNTHKRILNDIEFKSIGIEINFDLLIMLIFNIENIKNIQNNDLDH